MNWSHSTYNIPIVSYGSSVHNIIGPLLYSPILYNRGSSFLIVDLIDVDSSHKYFGT